MCRTTTPPPPPMPMDPPCQWTRHANAPPPVSKEETWPPWLPPLEGRNIPPPPRFFHQIAQNCPFLPSFLSVQWHVMGTILGVMCLVFNVDFHFSKCYKSPMEQTEIVW